MFDGGNYPEGHQRACYYKSLGRLRKQLGEELYRKPRSSDPSQEIILDMLLRPTIVLAFLALAELIDAGHAPKRPHYEPTPLQPYKAFPTSSPRRKTCFVKPGKKGGDDASKILRAFKKCNNGGTVVLDQEYTICTQLDLRFLKHVDIALTGTVKFCDDVERWLPRTFQFPFQDGSSWWLFGGEDINLYGAGTGTIDGNGQAWYDAHAADSKVKRPLLFVTDGWKGGSITGLKLRQSPNVS